MPKSTPKNRADFAFATYQFKIHIKATAVDFCFIKSAAVAFFVPLYFKKVAYLCELCRFKLAIYIIMIIILTILKCDFVCFFSCFFASLLKSS